MTLLKYLFFLIFLNSYIISKTIDINQISKKIDLLSQSYLYIDNNIEKTSFEQIKNNLFIKMIKQ